jgi:hypothetical protein
MRFMKHDALSIINAEAVSALQDGRRAKAIRRAASRAMIVDNAWPATYRPMNERTTT